MRIFVASVVKSRNLLTTLTFGYKSVTRLSRFKLAEANKTVAMSTRPKTYKDRNETRPTKNNGTYGFRQKGPLPGAARSLEEAKEKYEFFWGKDSPFSQFFWVSFKIEGIQYNCAEQYMMYKKAEVFDDRQVGNEILSSKDPPRMKTLGRKVRNFDEEVWASKSQSVVAEATEAKFSQNESLKELLFATYPKILAEASPADNLWGIGYEEDHKRAWDERTWRGKNQLGYIITRVRDQMMEKEGLIKPKPEFVKPYADAKKKYEYFWRNQSPFSQWHISYFTVGGVEYNCAEQYMMQQKAELFNDKEIAAKVMRSKDPKDQKALGRKVEGFDSKVWDERCRDVVRDGNIAKFSQSKDLKRALFATHPKILVEASPLDTIWGIGLAEDDQLAWDQGTWKGKNYLGYVLTDVRKKLMEDEGINTNTNMNGATSQQFEGQGQAQNQWQSKGLGEGQIEDQGQFPGLSQGQTKGQGKGQGSSGPKKKPGSNASGVRKPREVDANAEASSLEDAKKKYRYFWDKSSPFSQIYAVNFTVDGVEYNCGEQYLMHQKAVMFGDDELASKLMLKKDGKNMKSLAKKVKNFDEEVWNAKCQELVEKGSLEKFTQVPKMKQELLDTHPKQIVFANPKEEYWGIGVNKDEEEAWNESTWKGQNHLGKILVKVRKQIRELEGLSDS